MVCFNVLFDALLVLDCGRFNSLLWLLFCLYGDYGCGWFAYGLGLLGVLLYFVGCVVVIYSCFVACVDLFRLSVCGLVWRGWLVCACFLLVFSLIYCSSLVEFWFAGW